MNIDAFAIKDSSDFVKRTFHRIYKDWDRLNEVYRKNDSTKGHPHRSARERTGMETGSARTCVVQTGSDPDSSPAPDRPLDGEGKATAGMIHGVVDREWFPIAGW